MEHALIYLLGYGLYFIFLLALILLCDFIITSIRRRRLPRYRCQFIGRDVWPVVTVLFIFSVAASELTDLVLTLIL